MEDIAQYVQKLGQSARKAAGDLAALNDGAKTAVLKKIAAAIVENRQALLDANAKDVEAAVAGQMAPALIERLKLNDKRINGMAEGVLQIAGQTDPVGEITDGWVRPNGLRIRRVRVPLGVVGIIYENRPNVTSDAAALCIKSGNVAFLRGSSGAIASNVAIANVLREGVAKAGLPENAVVLVEDTSRESAVEFMRLRGVIDCLVPRGGPSLIASILEHATVPYVIDGDGNCHVYVDAAADLDMALDIIVNAKCSGRACATRPRASSCTGRSPPPSCPVPPPPSTASSWSATPRRVPSSRWPRPPTTTTRRSSWP